MLAAEAWADRPLFIGVVECDLGPEEIPQRQRQPGDELEQQQGFGGTQQGTHSTTLPGAVANLSVTNISQPETTTTQNKDSGRKTFQPSRINWS